MDRVEHSQSPAPHAATEMNFGLHSARGRRLAQHGRPGQGSTYLRTAIIRSTHEPWSWWRLSIIAVLIKV